MRKKLKITCLFDYLMTCENKREIFYFNDPIESYNYGNSIRENIKNENKLFNDDLKIEVDISGNVVRITIPAEELATVGSGC